MNKDRPNILAMQAARLAAISIGAGDNGAEFPSSTPTFAHYLRNLDHRDLLGYRFPRP